MNSSLTNLPSKNSIHISAFDTVRGLAAFSVVFSHYFTAYGAPTRSGLWKQVWSYTPLHIVWDGFAAVSLFYVLSGLVLSLKYFRDTPSPNLSGFKFSEFFTGRVFRIWTPYLAVFLLSYALRRWIGFYEGATVPPVSHSLFSTWNAAIPFTRLVSEGLLLQSGDFFLVPQGWTLPIELAISFFVPVGILLASRNTGWLIFFTVLLIGPLGATSYIFHFAAGILLAKYYSQIRDWLGPRRGWKVSALLLGLILYTFRFTLPVYFRWELSPSIPWLVTGAGSALLLMVVIASESARSFLSISWLKFIGRVSYSIYLVHFMALIILVPRLFELLHFPNRFALVAWWIGLFVLSAATLGLAALSYRWVEAPSMAFGKSLPGRIAAWRARRGQPASGK